MTSLMRYKCVCIYCLSVVFFTELIQTEAQYVRTLYVMKKVSTTHWSQRFDTEIDHNPTLGTLECLVILYTQKDAVGFSFDSFLLFGYWTTIERACRSVFLMNFCFSTSHKYLRSTLSGIEKLDSLTFAILSISFCFLKSFFNSLNPYVKCFF